jgi:hypothetical protein
MRVADWLTRNPTMHTLCTKCSKPIDLRTATTSQESTFVDQVRRGYAQDTFAAKLLAWQQQPMTLDTQTRTLLNHLPNTAACGTSTTPRPPATGPNYGRDSIFQRIDLSELPS